MAGVMGAAPGHPREKRGSFHVRTGVAGKRAPPSMALLYCIGVIALLASAGRIRAPKVCIGSLRSLLALGSAPLDWLTSVTVSVARHSEFQQTLISSAGLLRILGKKRIPTTLMLSEYTDQLCW